MTCLSDVQNQRWRIIEALLLIATEGVTPQEAATVLGCSTQAARSEMKAYAASRKGQGCEVVELAGKFVMTTAPDLASVLDQFRAERVKKVTLSKAALEVLAVVTYAQPVTRSEIEELRGVRSDRALETLLEHGLVRVAGRRKSTGSPLLFRTTELFLEQFGLAGLSDLPTLEELAAYGGGEDHGHSVE